MKKFAVILLALSIAASFTGCGKNTDENTNQNVVENEPVKVEQPVVDVEAEAEPEPEKITYFKDINKKMWVSADCSVREKANKNSDKIGKLEMADQVKVTGEGVNACKGYYRIEFKGKTGYVKKTYLSDTKKNKPAKGDDKAISTVDKTTTNNSGGNNSSGGNKNTGNSSGKVTVNTDGGYAIGNGPSSGRGGDGGDVSGKGGSADVNPDIDTDRIH